MLNTYFNSTLPVLAEMSALHILVIGAIVYTVLSTVVGLLRNYVAARRSGLKVLISPITPYTLQWRLAASICEGVLVRFRWYRAIDWTCAWQDGDTIHKELGSCFMVVSPGLNVVCASDSKTIEYVLKDWRGFVKPDNVNEILGTFGQNVDTSNGDDWPRHRKIVAPCFSERASATVWAEAISQSNTMLTKWLSNQSADVVQDTGKLALNVISSVAFENQTVSTPTKGHVLSLHDALTTVMSTSISPALEGIMPWLDVPIMRNLMPRSIEKLMLACDEFRGYTTDVIANNSSKDPSAEAPSSMNLISTLIKANSADAKSRLSESELRGNVFIFTVGGLESTSATLAFALALLALHPEVQEWVREEVDEILNGQELESVEYKDIFPKLKRVLALMFETLRLYSPSPPLPRSYHHPSSPFSIPTSTSPSPIPLAPTTQIMLNSWASHATLFPSTPTSSSSFDPARWLTSSSPLSHLKSGFYPWGSGPRICPGLKFSQVEFCAVVVGVLGRGRVSVGSQGEGGREGVESGLSGARADPLLLGMRGEVRVWVEGR